MDTKIGQMPAYQRAIAKGHLGSCGASYRELGKPIIAVVNSWNEIVPGHAHLRDLAEDVKQGIKEAGGHPLEFNTIAICDGIAQGHEGMSFVLPSRELIADSIELMIRAHGIFDGMVMLGSCDKIVPAMLMAAARLNIPTAIVTGGPMINRIKPYESKNARRRFLKGEINEEQLVEATVQYYPTPGICPFLGTANTMCIVAETLGLSLPGSSLVPAMSPERKQIAHATGLAVMNLVREQRLPSQIMTAAAFENTTAVISAMGGSLNTVLHLPAIAYELKLDWNYGDFDRISRTTPLLTQVTPNSQEYTVADLYPVGGIPAIMKELAPVLRLEAITVNGKTVGENLLAAPSADGTIIRPFAQPFSPEGGIAVLQGNLAPQGAVVKSSAVPKDQWIYSGPAKVFDSEEECEHAAAAGKIQSGDVIVIRYEGPIGGPGMREMHRTSEIVAAIGNVAIVTDGRFSGASGGLSIGYLSPEAAEGGPIAFVKDGDRIQIDISKRSLHWEIDEDELSRRKENWQLPEKVTDSEFLRLYARHATSSARGAIRKLK